MVSFPSEVSARIDEFQKASGISSNAEAIRVLVERGMSLGESMRELEARCRKARLDGKPFGSIIAEILDNHPVVQEISIGHGGMKVTARTGHSFEIDSDLGGK